MSRSAVGVGTSSAVDRRIPPNRRTSRNRRADGPCWTGSTKDGATWTAFLRGLVARGLSGVKLVVSDAHLWLKARPVTSRSA